MSKNASSNGDFLPRHNAPTTTTGKSGNASARTFFGNGFPGTLTDTPMPKPFATYVSIKSAELASIVENHSTPNAASFA